MTLTLSLQAFSRPLASSVVSRLSTGPGGTEGNGGSLNGALSSDGRYLIFESSASNLVPGDLNGKTDIFRKDLVTGTVTRISLSAAGVEADGESWRPLVSADGRDVVFHSAATNLVPGDTNGKIDLFRKDIVTGEIIRLSTDGSRRQIDEGSFLGSGNPDPTALSPDGRYLVFESTSDKLVAGDTNNSSDIFLKDVFTGAVARISMSASGEEATLGSSNARFSPDGRYVIFESTANNLSPDDGDNSNDIFLKDLRTGAVTVVSTNSEGQKANAHCYDARFSANGRYVVFNSSASNLVAGDTNNKEDIFRKDLQTGQVVRVSTNSAGAESSGISMEARISADGRYVAFLSEASNLVAGDTNGVWDVFRKDLLTGETLRLSTSATGVQALPGQWSGWGMEISADGRMVILGTAGSLIPGDANNAIDIVRVDAELMARAPAVVEGRYVELRLGTGDASSVSLAWGDGTSDTVLPSGGSASFSHTYASAGTKNAVATVVEGGLSRSVSYVVDLASGQMARNVALADTITGSAGADRLEGDDFSNCILGGQGGDTLKGLSGNDRLKGAAGKDILTGGSGKDVFVFDTKPNAKTNKDNIIDFKVKDDSFWLDNAVFTKLGKKGTEAKPAQLSKSFFTVGDKAKDKNDYVIYDKAMGVLLYDADGSGRGKAVEFASVSKKLAISYKDFFVM